MFSIPLRLDKLESGADSPSAPLQYTRHSHHSHQNSSQGTVTGNSIQRKQGTVTGNSIQRKHNANGRLKALPILL